MKTVFEHLRESLLKRAGVIRPIVNKICIEELYKTEWSLEFESLMRNRLVMGAIRYGKLGAKGKPQYNRVKVIRDRLDEYEKTGNVEYLVDIANVSLLEFVESNHPNKHFEVIDESTKNCFVEEL